jgi:hypothetical protein
VSTPPGARGTAGRNLAAALALLEQLKPAFERRNRARLHDIVGQLVALRAPLGGQWQQLAQIAVEIGELRMARRAIDLFVEGADGDPAAQYRKAGLLSQVGAWDEAHALLRTLAADVPDPVSHAFSRGTSAMYLGDVAEAREQLEYATRLRPQLGSAWQALGTLVDYADEPELAERLIALEPTMERAPSIERALYYYALGKAHADRGEHAQAFAAFDQAARRMKAGVPYRRDYDELSAQAAVQGFTAETIAAIAHRQSEPTTRTIFVTGLPRSGTTLVEQILTRHSQVSDGAEISRLRMLSREIGGLTHDELAAYVGEHGVASAAQLWNHWLDERFPGPGRIVDKTVGNTRFLGLAASLLPEAPLVWMTRDPLDRAWSCFRTYFSAGAPWSFDLEDIAFHFRLEDELLRRWQDILGDRLLVVPLEQLVTNPVDWIPRILSHCGLTEEPDVFVPHESSRAVTTSSVMQVRRPINRDGIGSAEPYREFLKPFIDAYYG